MYLVSKGLYLIFYLLGLYSCIFTGDITVLGYIVGLLVWVVLNCLVFTNKRFEKDQYGWTIISCIKFILFVIIGYSIPIFICLICSGYSLNEMLEVLGFVTDKVRLK